VLDGGDVEQRLCDGSLAAATHAVQYVDLTTSVRRKARL